MFFTEQLKLYFSNGKTLIVSTEDSPHFYGEGDLDLVISEENHSENIIDQLHSKEISQIKLFTWKANGISLFKRPKYLVQIEFYHKNGLIISIGFFYMDHKTKQMECLITGELAFNTKNNLSIDSYTKNLIEERLID